MKIVHIASELAPIAKVGGLADFIQGLSAALMDQGETVSILLPFYTQIDKAKLKELKIAYEGLTVQEKGEPYLNTVWSAKVDKLELFLIQPKHPANYFERDSIYGEKDDPARFSYFSRAALEYLLQADIHPDIIHLHDWITGLCAPLYYELYRSFGLKAHGIVTTLHNLCYQGVCSPKQLNHVGLNASYLLTHDKLQHQTKSNRANILKGAIIYSDHLTTVSPSYCEEIKGKEGFGLGPLLIEHEHKLTGILNAIDIDYWNPTQDPHLPLPYPPKNAPIASIVEVKKKIRTTLAKEIGLDPHDGPLVASITRLVKQKGPELIRIGLEATIEKGGQAILLASTPEKSLRKSFDKFQHRYRDHRKAYFFFEFNEHLAHLTFAAADILLVPSLFEPCGLTQMIALRYGTIPIVHSVGGLKDTIFDADDSSIPTDKHNGYTFSYPSPESLLEALHRALNDFHNHKKKWEKLIANGMQQDLSWHRSGAAYRQIYHFTSIHQRT